MIKARRPLKVFPSDAHSEEETVNGFYTCFTTPFYLAFPANAGDMYGWVMKFFFRFRIANWKPVR